MVGNRDQIVDVVLQHALKCWRWFVLDANAKRLEQYPSIFLLYAPIFVDERDPNFLVRQLFGDREPFFHCVCRELQDADREGNE